MTGRRKSTTSKLKMCCGERVGGSARRGRAVLRADELEPLQESQCLIFCRSFLSCIEPVMNDSIQCESESQGEQVLAEASPLVAVIGAVAATGTNRDEREGERRTRAVGWHTRRDEVGVR